MALEFHCGRPLAVGRLGVLPGTFNPPTVAHLALARAALARVEQVLFVLPRSFPHKGFDGASFEDRVAMLHAAVEDKPRFATASSAGGLFIEIARECRQVYGPQVRTAILCGRDAAERIVEWDYGHPAAFRAQLQEFDLLVAARGGEYCPPGEYAHSIRDLELAEDLSLISATEVRENPARPGLGAPGPAEGGAAGAASLLA